MWPFRRHRTPQVSPEAEHAAWQTDRLLDDAKNLDARVEQVARQSAEIRRVNHIGEAVAKSIRGV